ncbi:hypothetical protein CHARACLAT_010206 [Characodon lateralis]|uniref:Uncharacterized protein n=1 Tax=Characodon lateralis TaxID=208331 RepID=A0ABU7CX23_9TELE|nr:hypothetical protein [Characodon lateralis]
MSNSDFLDVLTFSWTYFIFSNSSVCLPQCLFTSKDLLCLCLMKGRKRVGEDRLESNAVNSCQQGKDGQDSNLEYLSFISQTIV